MSKIKHTLGFFGFVSLSLVNALRSRRLWMAVAFIVWTYLTAWVFNHYYFQSPVKTWQCFMCERKEPVQKIATVSAALVTQDLKPVPTEKEIVMALPHGEDLWKIYFLESTHGKNDGCRAEGKFGGFGVMSDGKVVCYESFQKAAERAEFWYAKALSGHTRDEALCIWNTGRVQPMCTYSMTFNTL